MALGLRKDARPLLRMVRNKPHAQAEDHATPFPTPPSTNQTRASSSSLSEVPTEEDVTRDPVSSEEEDSKVTLVQDSAAFRNCTERLSNASELPQTDGGGESFKMPSAGKSSSASKESLAGSSDDDGSIFSTQVSNGSFKKRRIGSGGQPKSTNLINIHAPPRPKSTQRTYGKQTNKTSRRPSSGFKDARKEPVKPATSASGATFKAPRGAFEFGRPDLETQEQHFRAAAEHVESGNNLASASNTARLRLPPVAFHRDLASIDKVAQGQIIMDVGRIDADGFRSIDDDGLMDLSDPPSSPEVEDIKELNLPPPQPYVAKLECSICGQEVDLRVKQNFEDDDLHGRSKQLTFRQQQRFCRYHKATTAERLWRDRGYPDIDWHNIVVRLQNYHDHVEQIITQERPSFYRLRLEQRLATGAKTALKSMGDDERHTASAGYYGTRGEKLLMEHILSTFADTLRDMATSDKLVSASGVAGGVSGYVQAVLVPEMAVALVREDMKVNAEQARLILADSSELGELLHAEQDELVRTASDDEGA